MPGHCWLQLLLLLDGYRTDITGRLICFLSLSLSIGPPANTLIRNDVQVCAQNAQKISEIGNGRPVQRPRARQICFDTFHMSTNACTHGFTVSTAWILSSLQAQLGQPGAWRHLNTWTDAPVVAHSLQVSRLRRTTADIYPATDSDMCTTQRLTQV